MAARLEDYALVGDLQSAALVSADGEVDWLCLPRFDSPSCFSALLGEAEHGRWRLAPAGSVTRRSRRYRAGTLVLETDFETPDGAVRVIDFMPRRGDGAPQLMRIVEGLRGRVEMRMELTLRPDYGSIKPWIEPRPDGLVAVAGPDAFRVSTPVALRAEDGTMRADFIAVEGARERFVLGWWPSHLASPPVEDADSALARTEAWWRVWSARCSYAGEYADAVRSSLVALKAMTYEPTGAVIAAPTTSLPEEIGGVRNWDYRYCWLRDSALTLEALLIGGYTDEALGFRDFLLRCATGDPAKIQIMYGVGGERRLSEFELPDLPGYEGSRPVRVGNAASEQFQLDVYGEVLATAYAAAVRLGRIDGRLWPRWRVLVDYVGTVWREPDDGIWEARGDRRHYTYSKVMAWVVFDRAVKLAEQYGFEAPTERWARTRDEIHADVCEHGYDAARGTFTQYYGSKELDADTLNIPLVGFLPGDDERVTGTIDAVMDGLARDGFVTRYSTDETDDGLPGTEGQFLACSFWMVSALAINDRLDEARAMFERLLELRNDVGLLAEEYDVDRRRQVGNFPQAFSHLALIEAANAITQAGAPERAAPAVAVRVSGSSAPSRCARPSRPTWGRSRSRASSTARSSDSRSCSRSRPTPRARAPSSPR